jgi:hypothetical protein
VEAWREVSIFLKGNPLEPSPKTFEEIGKLCGAWSYLEMQSEATLWGILKIDQELGEVFTWKMGMRERWQMICREAKKRLPTEDHETLKAINKLVEVAMRDRNIVVHGLIHAKVVLPYKPPKGSPLAGGLAGPHSFDRIPCWSIYMGEAAAKSFEVSTLAVITIRENIMKISDKVQAFNSTHSYTETTEVNDSIESGWPLPL